MTVFLACTVRLYCILIDLTVNLCLSQGLVSTYTPGVLLPYIYAPSVALATNQ